MKKTLTTLALAVMMATGVASAQTSVSLSNGTSTATTTQATKNICVASAVYKRDSAIIVAHDAFSASVKAALVARRDSLKAGWTNDDKVARAAAWGLQKKERAYARTSLLLKKEQRVLAGVHL